jgi:predicted AlkP superfamily phosphohydrolase/phosphomutase
MGTRILFIGIDAADKDLIQEWSASGVLPTFRRLLDEAAWGTTTNPPGLYVGAVWPSFYTGVSPARHGRYCYRQIRSASYEVRRMRPIDVKAEPFWAALSRAGRRVAVVDVPKTFPMRDINGIHIVDWGTHDPDFPRLQTSPRALARTLRRQFEVDPVGICDSYAHTAADLTRLRDALRARARRKAELSAHYLASDNWDCFLTVFTEAHCAGHQLWHLHDPTHPQYDPQLAAHAGDPLRDVYVAIDRALGHLLENVDNDTTVCVLASHGMGTHYDATSLLDLALHRLEGTMPNRQHTPHYADLLGWFWQRLPTAVRTGMAPLHRGLRWWLDARPSQLDGGRRYFAVPNNDVFGGVRINLVGREPHGRVSPGAEAEALCAALSNDLRALTNIDTREPVVCSVVRTRDLYAGPYLNALPDLLVEWNRTAPILGVDSPKTGRIDAPSVSSRTGDHTASGLFFALGPSVRPGPVGESVSVMDFAPTVGALLGVHIPGAEGSPIGAIAVRERAHY